MDFCTLGMLILDAIHPLPPAPPSDNILGGAGTFAALGARLFQVPPHSQKVGWTIHRGYDFPKDIEQEIESWETGVQWIETPERQTTRAVNEYVAGKGEDFRAFRYTSEKIRVDESHLTREMVCSKSFHMVCSPERCMSLVKGIRARRKSLEYNQQMIVVWEPVPDLCTPTALQLVKLAASFVDVISPNLAELSALFAENETEQEQLNGMDQRCLLILDGLSEDHNTAVVVRCGSKGCYVRSTKESRMFPAYWHGPESKNKIRDPTGGGNQFLGGMCIGLQSDEPTSLTTLEKGAVYGNIAASFAVEQIGVPKLSTSQNGEELWNGESVEARLKTYMSRLQLDSI